MRWTDPARWAGSPRGDGFIPRSYGIFYLSSIKHLYNKQWRNHAEQMFLYYLLSEKKPAKQNKAKIKSKTKLVKENSFHLT